MGERHARTGCAGGPVCPRSAHERGESKGRTRHLLQRLDGSFIFFLRVGKSGVESRGVGEIAQSSGHEVAGGAGRHEVHGAAAHSVHTMRYLRVVRGCLPDPCTEANDALRIGESGDAHVNRNLQPSLQSTISRSDVQSHR